MIRCCCEVHKKCVSVPGLHEHTYCFCCGLKVHVYKHCLPTKYVYFIVRFMALNFYAHVHACKATVSVLQEHAFPHHFML